VAAVAAVAAVAIIERVIELVVMETLMAFTSPEEA
jgi:hypothetical protein